MTLATLPPIGQGAINASYIEQLANAQAILQTFPDLPLSPYSTTYLHFFLGSPEDIDGWATALGVPAKWNGDRTHYAAERRAGPNLAFRAVYIIPEAKARSAAAA